MHQLYDITDEAFLKHAINDYIGIYSTERPRDRYNCITQIEVYTQAFQHGEVKPYPIAKDKRIEKYKVKWCA